MSLILVAHGTRRPAGVGMIGDLAERVGKLLHRRVQVAFVDVLGPTPSEVLAAAADTGKPAIVVPAFLSRGYHAGTDLPTHVATSGHPDVVLTPALGPNEDLTEVVAERLAEAGWQPGDAVVLAAAGTSSPMAQADLRWTARYLAAQTGSPVQVGFAATGGPTVAEAVAGLRETGAARVAVASYLLADGVFQQRLRTSGADLVAEPLGIHRGIVRLVVGRFLRARMPVGF